MSNFDFPHIVIIVGNKQTTNKRLTTMESTTTTSTKKTVLIIGAGIGGLVLANYIKTHDKDGLIDIQIFERDRSEDSRLQGYVIGVNAMGMKALTESLSDQQLEALKSTVFECPSQFIIADRSLAFLLAIQRNQVMNRGTLRQELINAHNLQPTIHYDKRLVSYTEDEQAGKVTATFEDGTSYIGDFLVGADGVRSTVRKQKLPDFKFANVNVYRIQSLVAVPNDTVDQIFNPLLDVVYKGNKPEKEESVAIKSIGNQQNSIILCKTNSIKDARDFGLVDIDNLESFFNNDSTNTTMLFWQYEYRPLPVESLPETREQMLEVVGSRLSGYHPLIQKVMVEMTKPHHLLYDKIEALTEADHTTYPAPSRVTLLGDAAHCMVSHAGMGGNCAIADGVDLGKIILAIVSEGKDLTLCMQEYETNMLARGFAAVNMSRSNTERMHARPVGVIGEAIRNTFMRLFYKLIVWGIIKLD
ncbi:hypothetical protein DFA_09246 [Cavenderia fasciculata]|uniref:FAD-binding domain-containing protein n=1 Tax=Cavenderia fasciculata TaxID=261658 RepID=F4Q734_CACFS|nr:uncharacterized protein DFA_09246 [Cavenderia fasciculata]EGG16216.1 hypothetical protein DFA_09246 [Cavenderia fasciculata]|eukprot:XP_004354600.1 hypothetical protein DFA_09246 [Cavenderia fasciculata]